MLAPDALAQIPRVGPTISALPDTYFQSGICCVKTLWALFSQKNELLLKYIGQH
jgi:hypothetical protein